MKKLIIVKIINFIFFYTQTLCVEKNFPGLLQKLPKNADKIKSKSNKDAEISGNQKLDSAKN